MFFGVYIFAALHSTYFIPYAIAAAAFYVIDRAIRFFWGLWPRKSVQLKVKPGNCIQLVFPKHPLARGYFRYKIGQYVFINFPTMNLLEWHPFTISSGPDERTGEVHIKGLGDHTNKLIDKASKAQSIWCRIDGPYGKFTLNYKRYPVILTVGGGVGITPLIAMLKDIYCWNMDEDLKRSVKRSPHLKHVYFVWTCPNEEVYGWFKDTMEYCREKQGKNGYPTLNAFVYITRAETVSNPDLYTGRPNLTEICDQMEKETSSKRYAVFACGPEQLVNAAWDESVKRSLGSNRWEFHHETFDF